MKNYNLKFKIFLLAACSLFLIPYTFYPANAKAAPQFLTSWQAQSYAPSWYQGKVWPTQSSQIEIAFEIVDGGKLTDLSKTTVRWYVNDKLIKNENDGLGIQSVNLSIPDYPGQETEIRISLPNYKGETLDNILHIPVAAPEVVINSFFGDDIYSGENFFEAIPFFFNASKMSDFSFSWLANNQAPQSYSDKPWQLNLNIDSRTPAGFTVNLKVAVQNILNQMELAIKDIQLRLK